jgi:hypothetical protein
MGRSHKFIDDLDSAIDCFLPVLHSLRIKEEDKDNIIPVCLSLFSELSTIDSIKQWDIVLLKANLHDEDNAATFMLKLFDRELKDNKMRCYIVIDEIYFLKNKHTRVIHETRMMIAVHEFMHFLSCVYARLENTPKEFLDKLNNKLSKKIDIWNKKETLELYKFLNKLRPIDDFTKSKQTRDEHFRLGKDDTSLNYTDIYRNFILSHQLFDKYFTKEDKEKFCDFWRKEQYGEAYEVYISIAKHIAQEEWIPENFAILQAGNILNEYYSCNLLI